MHSATAFLAASLLALAPAAPAGADEDERRCAPYRSGYARLDGSSFSAALASGAAAVARWSQPSLDRAGVVALLAATAVAVDPYNRGLAGELGAGVPDVTALARRALRRPPRALGGALPSGGTAVTGWRPPFPGGGGAEVP